MAAVQTGQLSLYPPEPAPDPQLCWLWLAAVLGPASPCAGQMIETFGSAQEAWLNRESMLFFQLLPPGAAQRAEDPDLTPDSFRPLAARCQKKGIRILCCDEPEYPERLREISDLPLVLYCTGDLQWLSAQSSVGVIGSRSPTPYGVSAAGAIGRDLAKAGAVIVSGLADGLDSEGHRAALAEQQPTVGVQGVAIDRVYPASNAQLRRQIEQNGCVISEYGPGGGIGKNGFLQRNRLIAALSLALLVVEAKEHSGTMSTVSHAERYGRPVYAVPGSIFMPNSDGTNLLIRGGRAKAAVCAADLADVLGLRPAAARAVSAVRREKPLPKDENERRALSAIGPEPQEVDQIAAASGLPVGSLLAALLGLTLGGWIMELPGRRYMLR